jgi:hypothetical protein
LGLHWRLFWRIASGSRAASGVIRPTVGALPSSGFPETGARFSAEVIRDLYPLIFGMLPLFFSQIGWLRSRINALTRIFRETGWQGRAD